MSFYKLRVGFLSNRAEIENGKIRFGLTYDHVHSYVVHLTGCHAGKKGLCMSVHDFLFRVRIRDGL